MERKNITGLALSFLVFVTTLAAAYMFSTLEITINSFLTINIFPIITALFLTPNGIVFIVLAGLPLALILLIGEEFEYTPALIFAEAGYLLAAIIGALVFGLFEWLLPLVFAALGIAWGIKWLKLKESELLSKFKFSAGSGAAGKIILVSLLGFLIFIALTGFSQSAALEEAFIPELLDVALGDQEEFRDSIMDMTIGISVESQKAIINSLTGLDSYNAMGSNADTDVVTFVSQTEALKREVNGANYNETLKARVETEAGDFDITSQILDELPIMGITKYIWLSYVIFAFILAHMVGTLIVKNLAAIYYVIFKRLYENMFIAETSFEASVEKKVKEDAAKVNDGGEPVQSQPQENKNIK